MEKETIVTIMRIALPVVMFIIGWFQGRNSKK